MFSNVLFKLCRIWLVVVTFELKICDKLNSWNAFIFTCKFIQGPFVENGLYAISKDPKACLLTNILSNSLNRFVCLFYFKMYQNNIIECKWVNFNLKVHAWCICGQKKFRNSWKAAHIHKKHILGSGGSKTCITSLNLP